MNANALIRIVCLALLVSAFSCNNGQAAKPNQPADTGGSSPNGAAAPPPADNSQSAPQYTAYFDSARAWMHLHKQVAFGPRVPGSRSHTACRRYIEQELKNVCGNVVTQEFTVALPVGDTLLANIIGSFNVEAPRRIMLAAHWDSRPTADMNPAGERDKPIDGANDGASGVAVLLELARVFSEHKPTVGVDLVFFDGEDYGPGDAMMYLGARDFAKRLKQSQIDSYNYGILLDMVGDSDLDIHPESNSSGQAGDVFGVAFELSNLLGYSCFKESGSLRITDDHVQLLKRGVRMYDFIDINYPYWHTTQDTEDKCSKDSLEAVGRTVENMVYLFPNIYAP